ncbi:hypothetical protein OUZ56_025283 [Daphnia magna]|uniref:MULE transposase domain-containing protein n=1 Tax=Daphnia magna TaxID=35525 RepID=A0ABQ9ZJD5_9CRUS|nr:hypothetical protein OUZ56_025283 [Daphnia magna]
MDLNGANQFFFGRVTAGDGEALVFVNVEFIASHEMHTDGNFPATPRGFYQLASLHAISYGTAIAVASFLVTNKSRALYECCLRRLLEVSQQIKGRVPEPSLFVSDYELLILQSMSTVFPTGRARGCYYHSGMVRLLPRIRPK